MQQEPSASPGPVQGGVVNRSCTAHCFPACSLQVRIYAAGAWHNAVLAVTCKAFRRFLPYMLSPFYLIPDGSAYVSGVAPTSALSRQLAAGDGIAYRSGMLCSAAFESAEGLIDTNGSYLRHRQLPCHASASCSSLARSRWRFQHAGRECGRRGG